MKCKYNSKMITLNEILEKLKDIISQELGDKKLYNKDVAEALSIKYDNFRKQKARGTIPYPEIMFFLAQRKISINWFFFNQLPESLIEPTSNHIILKYQKSVHASSGAGAINYHLDTTSLIIDKQLLDYLNANYNYTEIIKNTGDSMEPNVPDNSLVFVDKNDTYIKSKNIYLINIDNTLYIKRIKIKDKSYYINSINNIYKDVKIEQFEIIGRVKGVLVKI